MQLTILLRVSLTGQLGDNCSTDADCNSVLEHSRCHDVTMTCACDDITGYKPLDDGTCDIREFI